MFEFFWLIKTIFVNFSQFTFIFWLLKTCFLVIFEHNVNILLTGSYYMLHICAILKEIVFCSWQICLQLLTSFLFVHNYSYTSMVFMNSHRLLVHLFSGFTLELSIFTHPQQLNFTYRSVSVLCNITYYSVSVFLLFVFVILSA